METTPETEMSLDSDIWDITFNVVSAVCWGVVTPIAIVTNAFTLLVVHRTTNVNDINHIFIATFNLFILLSCLCFALPASISATAGGKWILGSFLCTAQSLLIVYLHYVCGLLLLSYSLERYMFLLHPLRYPTLITVKRAKRLVGCILVLPFLSVPLIGFLSEWNGVYISSCHVCAPYSDPILNKVLFVSSFILLTVVPSVVAYVVHTALLLTARQHLRRIIAGIPQSFSTPNGNTVNDGAVTDRRLQVAAFDRKIRVNKSRLISLIIVSPLTMGAYLILDLALFGYTIQRYLVLVGNLSIFSAPTLLGLKAILSSRTLKQSAKQVFTCCCHSEP